MKKQKMNYSKEHLAYINKEKKTKRQVLLSQIGLLVLIVGLWELLTTLNVLDSFFFSSPSKICSTIYSLFVGGSLFTHIGITLLETLIAFAFATITGTIIAVLLWLSPFVRKTLEPYLVVLNSLPKIALGPIIIIWFGSGMKSIIVMAFLIMIVLTIISMLNAFLSCDESKILLMESMGASKLQILFMLILPNALPEFVSVLKINVGMSWVGTIMGEYLTSSAGLGYLILYGGQVFKLDLVMSSTVILCVLAGGMYFAVAKLEKTMLKHYTYTN